MSLTLTATEVAGAIVGCLVAVMTLAGMLWRLIVAVVRHVEATKQNTAALGTLGTTLSTHITRTDHRLSRHEARLVALERRTNVTA